MIATTLTEAAKELRTMAEHPDGWGAWSEVAEDLRDIAALIEKLDDSPPVQHVIITVEDLTPRLRELVNERVVPHDQPGGCLRCFNCLDQPELEWRNPVLTRMVMCPGCGNKRCPRATNHIHRCTGSNEPGQPGSRYSGFGEPKQERRER